MSFGLVREPTMRRSHLGRRLLVGAACLSVATCSGESLVPPVDAPNIDLSLTMSANLSSPPEGRTFVYTLEVANGGPLDASGVLAGDTLPSGVTYVSHSLTVGEYEPQTGLWTIGELPLGTVATLNLVARPASGTAGSAVTNTAGVLSTDYNDSIPDNNIAQTTVTVGAPLPPGTFDFSSDWSTATGTSPEAVSDGGRWDGVSGDNGTAVALEVLPGTAVRGDPWTLTPNVLAIYMRGSTHDYVISKLNATPPSTTHWGRCYIMFEAGANHQRNIHPFAYDPVGTIEFVYLGWGGGTAPWVAVSGDVDYRIGTEGVGFTSLETGTWYRYEWQIEYITPNTIKIWPRVSSMAGRLLYDATGFLHEDNPDFTLAEYLSVAGNVRTVNPTEATEVGLGQPGPAGTADTGTATYVAACAISTENWIGDQL